MSRGPHPGWLRPDWPAPARVHALFTTRAGGTSQPPFDTLNLGDHVGDAPQAVQANRQVLQAELQRITPQAHAVFLQQVHGTQVAALQAALPDGACADACVSTTPGRVCTIMVADCLPVLLTDAQGSVVAAAHAGWRGLAGEGGAGVLEAVFKEFSALALAGQAPSAITSIAAEGRERAATTAVATRTLAWLGPCIGPQAFEVGAEVRAAFCAHDAAAAQHFVAQAGGKYLADLAGLARQRLQVLGITQIYGNDGSPDWCTVTQASRFFSHRRDSAVLGGSGRMAACIWLG
jgi:copper oxidase (laccase) domain-containing protein